MSTNVVIDKRESLKDFLNENGCQTTEEVMTTLEPFFLIAEQGKFPLAKAEELDEDTIAHAAIPATPKHVHINRSKKEVKKIIFISASNPFSMTGRDNMTRWKNKKNDYLAYFDGALSWDFETQPRGMLLGNLSQNLADDLKNSLAANLGQNRVDSPIDVLGKNLGDILWYGSWNRVWGNLWLYVGFSLLNKQEQAQNLKPLVEILPKCIPLDFKAGEDEPETMVILCA